MQCNSKMNRAKCVWRSNACQKRQPTAFPTAKPTKIPTIFDCSTAKSRMLCLKGAVRRKKCSWNFASFSCDAKTAKPTREPTAFPTELLQSPSFARLTARQSKRAPSWEKTRAFGSQRKDAFRLGANRSQRCSVEARHIAESANGRWYWDALSDDRWVLFYAARSSLCLDVKYSLLYYINVRNIF